MMGSIAVKSKWLGVCGSLVFVSSVAFAGNIVNRPPPFLGTNANYNIDAASSNRMVRISDPDPQAGDDNLVWSHNGRYIAVDRSDPDVTIPGRGNKYIFVVDVSDINNVKPLGPRTFVESNSVHANITAWTWGNEWVLFGHWPTNAGAKCRIMSCSVFGDMDVREFLRDTDNPATHVFSPSVIFDPSAGKERLLFLSTDGPRPDEGVVNIWTVTYPSGGTPDWADKVPLSAFTNATEIESVRWSPELGTNYHPLVDRFAIVRRKPGGKEIMVFNGVQDVLDGATGVLTNLAGDARVDMRDPDASGGSQVSWTYDGVNLMYSRDLGPIGKSTSEIFTVRSSGTNTMSRMFRTPQEFDGEHKQWLCINPSGNRVAFTVNKRMFMLPMDFENPAVAEPGITNILSDGGYTRVVVPGEALNTNVSFFVTEPNSIDTNQPGYRDGAREFGAEGFDTFNFSTNVEMYLKYSESDLPTNVAPTELVIHYYNPTNISSGGTTGTWHTVPSMVDTNNQYVISTNITHFSIYAFGRAVAPEIPDGVTASEGAYAGKIVVAWNEAADAESYEVWRNMSDDSGSAEKVASGIVATSYEDSDVSAGTVYYYWIKAVNYAGTSGFSSSASGYAAGDMTLVPAYRFYSYGAPESTYVHLWTINEAERDALVAWPSWRYEGIGWYALLDSAADSVPLYRLYEPNIRRHLYTINPTEYVALTNTSWNGEGVQYFVYPTNSVSGAIPAHRFYHSENQNHHFTIDEHEKDTIIATPEWGYAYEGVAFYVFLTNTPPSIRRGAAVSIPAQAGAVEPAVVRSGRDSSVVSETRSSGEVTAFSDYAPEPAAVFDGVVYDDHAGQWWLVSEEDEARIELVALFGDYTGNGRKDLALYEKSAGIWLVLEDESGFEIARPESGQFKIEPLAQWGGPGFLPLAMDYDGDGINDLAVYHQDTALLYVATIDGRVLAWALEYELDD